MAPIETGQTKLRDEVERPAARDARATFLLDDALPMAPDSTGLA
ncbi:MAG: hypothetical protein ACR2K0_02925 [Acidimicrobiales bacterium]|jgi:hypothetical protein